MTSTPSQARPIIHDPAFVRALSQCGRRLLVAGVLIVLAVIAWAYLTAESATGMMKMKTAIVTCIAVVLLLLTSWAGLHAAARHTMDTMMVWVGGGFMLRVAIVVATLVAAKFWEIDTRLMATAIVVTILVGTGIEVFTLMRARIIAVEPLTPGKPE